MRPRGVQDKAMCWSSFPAKDTGMLVVTDCRCEICGASGNLEIHHMEPRHMGGSRRPEIEAPSNKAVLCRPCHRSIHERGWLLERSPEAIRVIDRHTGREIMRRLHAPDFDASSFFHLLNVMDGSLADALTQVPYLDDEQLVEAFRASRSLGKRSWLLQAAILYEAQRRSVYGDRSLEAIARRFETSLRQAEKYALVWRLFFASDGAETSDGQGAKNVNVDAFSLEEPSWYVVAATESPEPQRWLAYAQDKKAESPRYSISDFRGDIQLAAGAGIRVLEETGAPAPGPVPRVPWDCPWVKPYCTRSGRPSPAEECRCEEQTDSNERKPTGR